jgi:hypothetical protein
MLRDRIWRGKAGEFPAWGVIRVWEWAIRYVAAEAAGDGERLHEIDTHLALLFGDEGRHFAEEETRAQNVAEIRERQRNAPPPRFVELIATKVDESED